MKPYPLTEHVISRTDTHLSQGALIACLMIFWGLLSARGQSANNFDTQKVSPDKPATEAAKDDQPGDIAATPAPVSTTPSRYVAPAETSSYGKTISSAFSIGKRPTDIFGQMQDPDAKPIIKAPVPGTKTRAPVLKATPLSDIVSLLEVTTIMPGEKRFLLGTRSVRLGDLLPISFRGKELQIQVTEVTSRQISFKNLQTGEIAVRKLDILPAGMTVGLRGMTPPGMIQERANAPIILEMTEPIEP
jgi:hypothetical protein